MFAEDVSAIRVSLFIWVMQLGSHTEYGTSPIPRGIPYRLI
jgi:hypothetical protein